MATRRRRCTIALDLLVCAVLMSGCGTDGTGQRSAARDPQDNFGFQYRREAPDGQISNLLFINNGTDTPQIPVLRFTARDAQGNKISGLKVKSVFGSDRAKLVAPPGESSIDVLRFEGDDRRVAFVDVDVVSSTPFDGPVTDEIIDAIPLHDGASVTRNDVFDSVAVRNPSSVPISVGLVYMVYDMPGTGEVQSVQVVHHISHRTRVAANDVAIVPLEQADLRVVRKYAGTLPASVKAYLTP